LTTTATDRVLAGADIKRLSVRSDLRGAAQMGLHLVALVAAGWLAAIAHGFALLPAMLLLGLVQAALFAPVHETMHLTAFANRRANAVIGWLAGCPSLFNWHYYAAYHLAHHRFTQDSARDPELMVPPPSSMDTYLARVLAVNYWRARFGVIRDGWRGDFSAHPFVTPALQPRIVFSVRAMSVFVVACALASAVFVGWWAPLVFWIVPQLIGQPFLRLYLLTEHTLCSEDANGLTNTRTTLTNALVRLLMWNMSYHAEHHLYPSIPFHRLPDAHAVIRDRLGVVQPGYARWHAAYFEKIRRAA
jgi:fatty acid desaturase